MAPSLRHCLLGHLRKSTNANDSGPRFSVGFLTRLFIVVMEEEEERRKKLELEEDMSGRTSSRARLWNAIRNNLKREVGKRNKSICLSAAQVEALGTNARYGHRANAVKKKSSSIVRSAID